MELAIITFWQVVTLFLLILAGALSARTGIVPAEAKPIFSRMLLILIVPAMTFSSYLTEYSPEVGRNIGYAFLFSFAVLGLGILLVLLLNRTPDPNLPISRLGAAFSNSAYMGFPLITALFGMEGLMYASIFISVYNLLLWTVGVGLLSKTHGVRDIVRNILSTPVLFAVLLGLACYYLRIPIPAVLKDALGYLGNMNTPISMMITGMILSSCSVRALLTNRLLWKTLLLRLLIVPGLCILVFRLLGFSGTVTQVILLLEACPCAAVTSVLAVQYRYEESFAGGLVVISTLLSILTLPLAAMLLTM